MNLQLAFDLDEPRARSRDPVTSKLAAASAKELQARHHILILECLRKHGALSKDGIASRTRLDGVQTCRRLTELARAGLIKETGRTVLSTAGRSEREWEIA